MFFASCGIMHPCATFKPAAQLQCEAGEAGGPCVLYTQHTSTDPCLEHTNSHKGHTCRPDG
jgi:hypothetical protein